MRNLSGNDGCSLKSNKLNKAKNIIDSDQLWQCIIYRIV